MAGKIPKSALVLSRQKQSFSEMSLEIDRVVFCRTRYWSFGDLAAPVWRLFWYPEPGNFVVLEEGQIPLLPSNLYLIPANISFAPRQIDVMHEFHILFNFTPALLRLRKSIYALPANKSFLEKMNKFAASDEVMLHEPLMTIYGAQILGEALMNIPEDEWIVEHSDDRVLQAIRLMAKNLNRTLGNEEIAKSLGLSNTAFVRYFSQHVGISPQQYLNGLRVDKAARLLITTETSLEGIARQCGFVDKSHFSRVFKKYKAMAPGEYRKAGNQ